MQKITIVCQKTARMEATLAIFFHGWLMLQLEGDFVDELHQTGTNPYTLFTEETATTIHFVVTLLNAQALEKIGSVLLAENFSALYLQPSRQKNFPILTKQVTELRQEDICRVCLFN